VTEINRVDRGGLEHEGGENGCLPTRLMTVKCNVVFNQDNTDVSDTTAIIPGNAQSEGEKDKIIQAPQENNTKVDQPKNKPCEDKQHPEKESTPHQSPKSSNPISIPSSDDPTVEPNPIPQHKDQSSTQQYGCGQRARH
jgi:hypothetical protein